MSGETEINTERSLRRGTETSFLNLRRRDVRSDREITEEGGPDKQGHAYSNQEIESRTDPVLTLLQRWDEDRRPAPGRLPRATTIPQPSEGSM